MKFYPSLTATIEVLSGDPVSTERRNVLRPLILYIQAKCEKGEAVKLNFICTHNSRRSQMAQIWAHTASRFHGIEVECYSGGIEVTAFNPRAIEALRRTGFRVISDGDKNPLHSISYSQAEDPIAAYSKLYDDPVNPNSGFGAIMTCSDADENCPFIPGAEIRIPVRYEDPKHYDNTPEEDAAYDNRLSQIAGEMCYVFSKVKM